MYTRPYYFETATRQTSPLRFPTLAGLVSALGREEPGARGYMVGRFGPVAETCKGGKVRIIIDACKAPSRRAMAKVRKGSSNA